MSNLPMNFCIVGCGFIFNRHKEAIEALGGRVTGAVDIKHSKNPRLRDGIFFTDKMSMIISRALSTMPYAAICTPNNTHVELAEFFTRHGANVLIEKPACISLEELDRLKRLPNVNIVLQLRYNKRLQELRNKWQKTPPEFIKMEFEVHRGDWYYQSWKADEKQSGGLMSNIGAHYFDMMCWILGEPKEIKTIKGDNLKWAEGEIQFEKTKVFFSLSIDAKENEQKRKMTWGNKEKEKEVFDLTPLFASLHKEVYEDFIQNKGITIRDAEMGILLIDRLKNKLYANSV